MRALLVTGCILVAMAAHADYTLTYLGETPSTGWNSYGSVTDNKWDYVYQVNWTYRSVMGGGGPWWAIGSPGHVENITAPSGWTGVWMPSLTLDASNPLNGKPGILFTDSQTAAGSGTFGFESTYGPVLVEYDGPSDPPPGSGWQGSGNLTYSNPEPATMILTGLALGGGVWLRKRRASKAA